MPVQFNPMSLNSVIGNQSVNMGMLNEMANYYLQSADLNRGLSQQSRPVESEAQHLNESSFDKKRQLEQMIFGNL